MKPNKIAFGPMVIAILAIIPVFLWFLAPTYPPRFSSFEATLVNLGQVFGIVGTVFLSINFVISTRIRFLEKIFKGLNDAYKKHEWLGRAAFLLLIFHPLLLLDKYTNGTIKEIVNFLLPGEYWDINFGIFALGLMAVLILLTLHFRPRYDIWKKTHKLFGLVLLFAVLHIWMIPSDVASYTPLRIYMIGIAGIGLLAYSYKTLLRWFLAPKTKMQVTDIKRLNMEVTEITLKPESEFNYQAGQFIFVSFEDEYLGKESHPFSFASAPNGNQIKVAVKNLGDYTANAHKIKVGTKAKVDGPFGIFNYHNSYHKNQIWLAGGIGITPFMSMAEDLVKNIEDFKVDLFYAVNEVEDAVYFERLNELAENSEGRLKIYLHTFDEKGFLSAEYISNTIGGINDKDIFICGPPKMMKMLKAQFLQTAVDKRFIHSEEFSL